nr:immunoglobulin heavy chain junction region [Macaca mulatta]MOX15843.1 immunoglobulin heavy chain junction region [Macaca mulatta]
CARGGEEGITIMISASLAPPLRYW